MKVQAKFFKNRDNCIDFERGELYNFFYYINPES